MDARMLAIVAARLEREEEEERRKNEEELELLVHTLVTQRRLVEHSRTRAAQAYLTAWAKRRRKKKRTRRTGSLGGAGSVGPHDASSILSSLRHGSVVLSPSCLAVSCSMSSRRPRSTGWDSSGRRLLANIAYSAFWARQWMHAPASVCEALCCISQIST